MSQGKIIAGITPSRPCKTSIMKTKQNPDPQENRERTVVNNIFSRYLTLGFLENIPISTHHCIIRIVISNY